MSDETRSCPMCGSDDVKSDHLGLKGSTWPVLYGVELFKKSEVIAYACEQCGYIFLYRVGPKGSVEEG